MYTYFWPLRGMIRTGHQLGFYNERHHSSWSWDGNMLVAPRVLMLYLFLTCLQRVSIVYVSAPVIGSMKFSEWLTVLWINPCSFKVEYARHLSEYIVVPYLTSFNIIGSKVFWSHFSALKKRLSKIPSCLQQTKNP